MYTICITYVYHMFILCYVYQLILNITILTKPVFYECRVSNLKMTGKAVSESYAATTKAGFQIISSRERDN